MHELVHIILHLEDPETSKIFAGHSLFKEYTPEQQALEREAGYVAGMMLLNDDQLSSQIGIGHSFDRICYSHGMSKRHYIIAFMVGWRTQCNTTELFLF